MDLVTCLSSGPLGLYSVRKLGEGQQMAQQFVSDRGLDIVAQHGLQVNLFALHYPVLLVDGWNAVVCMIILSAPDGTLRDRNDLASTLGQG